jgi:hypothetical protein
MNYKDMTDGELYDVMNACAGAIMKGERLTPEHKITAAVVLVGRRLLDLTASSRRLERLTKWLIGLTIVLAVLTLILAVPEVGKLVAWAKAR